MQGLRLSPRLSYCLSGDERIFLDLGADHYFRLDPGDEAVLAALEARSFVPASKCRPLIDGGLLTFSSLGAPIAPYSHPLPSQSLAEELPGLGRAGPSDIAEVAYLLVKARLMVWRARKGRLARRLEPANAICEGEGEAIRRVISRFASARRFVPLPTNCLRDSLACGSFLKRRDLDADVVIGAKLHPFAAHCWVQKGDVVLNDNLSSAAGFSPILVL